VGSEVGYSVGLFVGFFVAIVGFTVGENVGYGDGNCVGLTVGLGEGDWVGLRVGTATAVHPTAIRAKYNREQVAKDLIFKRLTMDSYYPTVMICA
jgi:hypothetical protein